MPQYNELWNPFPHFTPKLQRRITWLAALGSLLVLAATIGILTLVDSSQTYCPGWIIVPESASGRTSIWTLVWFITVPVTVVLCWRALFMTERKLLAEIRTAYREGASINMEYPMSREEFRTVHFDSLNGITAALVVAASAAPLFFMLGSCSGWGW